MQYNLVPDISVCICPFPPRKRVAAIHIVSILCVFLCYGTCFSGSVRSISDKSQLAKKVNGVQRLCLDDKRNLLWALTCNYLWEFVVIVLESAIAKFQYPIRCVLFAIRLAGRSWSRCLSIPFVRLLWICARRPIHVRHSFRLACP